MAKAWFAQDRLRRIARRWRMGEAGAIAALTALLLPVLIGFAGLAVGAGVWLDSRRTLQTQADAAAMAGLLARTDGNVAGMVSEAQAAVVANGWTSVTCGTSGTDCAVTYLAASPVFGGEAVKVQLSRQQSLFFAKAYKDLSIRVRASAIAERAPVAEACFLALSTTGTGLTFAGDSEFNGPNCLMGANSTNKSAVLFQGEATVIARAVQTPGRIKTSGYPSIKAELLARSTAITDPLANADLTPKLLNGAALTTSAWNYSTCATGKGLNPPILAITTANYTANEGSYCAVSVSQAATNAKFTAGSPAVYYMQGSPALKIGTSNSGTGAKDYCADVNQAGVSTKFGTLLTSATSVPAANNHAVYFIKGDASIYGRLDLGPGVYYLYDGDLTLNSGSCLRGNHVTIVMTGSSSGKVGTIKVNSNATIKLTPPPVNLSGYTTPSPESVYKGISIYFDRRYNTGKSTLALNGNAFSDIGGIIYAPAADLSFSGNLSQGSSGACSKIIANTVTFTGNSTTTVNYTAAQCAAWLATLRPRPFWPRGWFNECRSGLSAAPLWACCWRGRCRRVCPAGSHPCHAGAGNIRLWQLHRAKAEVGLKYAGGGPICPCGGGLLLWLPQPIWGGKRLRF